VGISELGNAQHVDIVATSPWSPSGCKLGIRPTSVLDAGLFAPCARKTAHTAASHKGLGASGALQSAIQSKANMVKHLWQPFSSSQQNFFHPHPARELAQMLVFV
jgi:hypothetical protein